MRSLYLEQILQRYKARDLSSYSAEIAQLKNNVISWANTCYIEIINSGSRAKGTAISIASDVDYLVSLTSNCNEDNGGLSGIYNSLYNYLSGRYTNVRKQNVSVRINLNGLEVDITPARKLPGNTNDHILYVSKKDTWKQTNIQKHIYDISRCQRNNEIMLLKIWRELNGLDFPSIYLEYLTITNMLSSKPTSIDNLGDNIWSVLNQLASDNANPLFSTVIDPANSNNKLSDLLSQAEKQNIINVAKISCNQQNWQQIFR